MSKSGKYVTEKEMQIPSHDKIQIDKKNDEINPQKAKLQDCHFDAAHSALRLLQKQLLLRKGDKDRTVINKAGNSKDIIALFKRQSDR